MRHRIEGYRNFPGEHCGSVAMRGLLAHYCDLELPEDVVFGLGAGLDCMYMPVPGVGGVAFGRTTSMEVDLADALGVDYVEQTEPDDARAWQDARAEVLADRPTMLSGDIFHLDYRDYKVHFPGHRFVLLGFDDELEEVYIADRIREEPETCSLGALMRSRNPSEGMSTLNLWGHFESGEVRHDLATAARRALGRCSAHMLGIDSREAGGRDGDGTVATPLRDATFGIAGIRRFAEDLPGLAAKPDARALAGYNGSAIEKFGNGGGNFRRLYAGFLDWARMQDSALVPADASARATRAADGWTALAKLLWRASEGEDTWTEAGSLAHEIAGIEQALFEELAKRCDPVV